MTQKLKKKNVQVKIFIYFYDQKLQFTYPWASKKGRLRYRRSLQPSKENIQHFKKWNILTSFNFLRHFCPPDLIESGSGSKTLVTDKAVVINLISDDMFCLCLGCWTNCRTECSSRHKRANRRCPRFVTFYPSVVILLLPYRYLEPKEVFVPLKFCSVALKPGTGTFSISLIIPFHFAYAAKHK